MISRGGRPAVGFQNPPVFGRPPTLVLEARYNMGLTDLHPDVDELYKPKTLMIMAGIGF